MFCRNVIVVTTDGIHVAHRVGRSGGGSSVRLTSNASTRGAIADRTEVCEHHPLPCAERQFGLGGTADRNLRPSVMPQVAEEEHDTHRICSSFQVCVSRREGQ